MSEDKKKLQEILDGMEDYVHLSSCWGDERGRGFSIRWSEKGRGFGSYTILVNNTGQVIVDTENDGIQMVAAAFMLLLKNAITDVETDPEKHRAYNQAVDGYCGEHCKICYPDGPPAQ